MKLGKLYLIKTFCLPSSPFRFQAADRKDDSGGKNKDNLLDEDEFVDFYREITEREELKDIFKR